MNNVNLYQCVKGILLHEWDPIGVGGLAEAQDEYDAYVQPICEMLNQGRNVNEIYAYLRWVVNDYMCLDGNEDTDRIIAERLVKLSVIN